MTVPTNLVSASIVQLSKTALLALLVLSGSQIASWFPSFSVEVMHTRVDNVAEGQLPESRIEAMVSFSPLLFANSKARLV